MLPNLQHFLGGGTFYIFMHAFILTHFTKCCWGDQMISGRMRWQEHVAQMGEMRNTKF
jgi:hypothetical protein